MQELHEAFVIIIVLGMLLVGIMLMLTINEEKLKLKRTGNYRVHVTNEDKKFITKNKSKMIRKLIGYSFVAIISFFVLALIAKLVYIGAVTVSNTDSALIIPSVICITVINVIMMCPPLYALYLWIYFIFQLAREEELIILYKKQPLEIVIRNKHRRKDGRLLEVEDL